MLASGEVVNANASQHSDLYKALKGGGNKFGVVTRFDFKTFDFGTFWGGLLVVPTHNSKRQLEALQDFTKASGAVTDNYSAIESIHAYNSPGQTALGEIITYTKTEAYAAIFKKLYRHTTTSC